MKISKREFLKRLGIGGAALVGAPLPEFATSFSEKCGLSQCSRGPREKAAIIFSTYISERLDV